MNVASPSKPEVTVSVPKSDAMPVNGNARPMSAGGLSSIPGRTVEILDPVKRAEQAIGPFFEDPKFPSGKFSIDQDSDSGRYVYRLINRETKEVLKQFPGDYVLRRVAYYRELQGLVVNAQV
ncbi:flagellar protein FlaG [Sneathiella sp.]|uniref:flagellar protein FlaG n=1 Tax=Sneathiella sp. TaxID=1964365 RepID=UPI0035619245